MNNRRLLTSLIAPASAIALLLSAAPAIGDPPSILEVLGGGQGADETQDTVEDTVDDTTDEVMDEVNDAGEANDNDQPGSTIIQSVLDAGDTLLDDGRRYSPHQVELSAGVQYIINLTSNDFDTQAYLIDSEDNQIAANDDGPEMGTNSQIIFTPPADGTYTIGVCTVKAGKTGRYELTVNVAGNTPQPPQPDGEVEALTPPTILLTANNSLEEGQIYYSNDVQLVVGQQVVIETYCDENCDTLIELRRSSNTNQADENDEIVGANDDDLGRLGSRIVWTCDAAGAYYVSVKTYENSVGNFKLIIRDAVAGMREGFTFQNNELPKESHVYLGDFTLMAGENFVIETTNLSENVDTFIELRRSTDPTNAQEDDPILASNDDYLNENLASFASWTVDETGDYYIVLRNIGKTDGTCDVIIGFRE